jgi:hypothetical protein
MLKKLLIEINKSKFCSFKYKSLFSEIIEASGIEIEDILPIDLA